MPAPLTSHSLPHPFTSVPFNLSNCTPTELHSHLLHIGIPTSDADILLHEDVDGPSLPSLTHPHLQAMGIPTFGRRQHVLNACHTPTPSSPTPPTFQPAWKPTDPSQPSSTHEGLLSRFHLTRPHSAVPAGPRLQPHDASVRAVVPRPHSSQGGLPAHYPPSYAPPPTFYSGASPHYSPIASLPITPQDPSQPHLHSNTELHSKSYVPHSKQINSESESDFIAGYPSSHPSHPSAPSSDPLHFQRQARLESDLRYEEDLAQRKRERADVLRLKEELLQRERTRQRIRDAETDPTPQPSRPTARHTHRRVESDEVTPAPTRPFPTHHVVKPAPPAAVVPAPSLTPPPHSLRLEWVYGYNSSSSSTSPSTLLLSAKALIYPASNVVVVQSPPGASAPHQEHFLGHTSLVVALSAHPTSPLIASSSSSPPQLLVWDSTSPHLPPLVMPLGAEDVGVRTMGWSSCGRYLASTSSDPHATLRIWDWASCKGLASVHSTAGGEGVHSCQWSPLDPHQLVTVGRHHLAFWQWKDQRVKGQKAAIPPNIGTLDALAWSRKGYACVGTSQGRVLVYTSGYEAARVFDVMGGVGVTSMSGGWEGLVLGGVDGRVVLINKGMERVKTLHFTGKVRAVVTRGKGELAVGTRDGRIWAIRDVWDPSVKGEEEAAPVVEAHYDGELSGIAVREGVVVTAGGDDSVLMWDVDRKRVDRRARVGGKEEATLTRGTGAHEARQRATCVGVWKGGVGVGVEDGHLLVLSMKLKLLHRVHVDGLLSHFTHHTPYPATPCYPTCMAASPHPPLLLVGTSTGLVLLVTIDPTPVLIDCRVASTSSLTHVEWSADGHHAHVTDAVTASSFFGVSGKGLTPLSSSDGVAVRERRWSEVRSPVAPPVQALFMGWEAKNVKEGVVAVRGEEGKEGLAVVGGMGRLRLFRWNGLCHSGQHWNEVKAHVGRVGGVQWVGEKRVLSIGRDDRCLLQWRVV